MNKYKHLTFTDRLKIEAWQKFGIKPAQMAAELGVHISTIYRELKRGVYTHLNSDYTEEERYSPDIAEEKYRSNLKAKGAGLKIGNDHAYATYLEYKVSVEKYAPGAILGEIKREGLQFSTSISKTTFYRYIEDGVFLTITNKDLPVKKNKNKQKYNRVKPNRAPQGKSIEKRPAEVAERRTFGHWEMDCVEGKKGTKKTFLVLTERLSRYEIIRIMKDHTSASVLNALDSIERAYGANFSKVFQSITIDNGSEFSDYEGLERSCCRKGYRTKVYYCHLYSSYERGSNENQNKMIRRHYPKGISLENVTPADTRKIEKWINNYPRKIFDYHCSADIYKACINSVLSA
jgi:IS30 family transposase